MVERPEPIFIPAGFFSLIVASLAGAAVLVLGTFVQMPDVAVTPFLAVISIVITAFYAFVAGLVLGLPLAMLLRASGAYSLVSVSITGAVVAVSALLVLNMMSEDRSPSEAVASVGTFVRLCVSGAVAGATFFFIQRGIAGAIRR